MYALDDAYIHMAVARSLARHGVWGVTPYAFTSSTSSLAWPLLLALADLVVGVRAATPLVLNLAFAVAEKLARLAKARLARECAKLDAAEERALAEEGLAGGRETWPEY